MNPDAGPVPSVDQAGTGVQPLPTRSLLDVAAQGKRRGRGHSRCAVCKEAFEPGDRRVALMGIWLCPECAQWSGAHIDEEWFEIV